VFLRLVGFALVSTFLAGSLDAQTPITHQAVLTGYRVTYVSFCASGDRQDSETTHPPGTVVITYQRVCQGTSAKVEYRVTAPAVLGGGRLENGGRDLRFDTPFLIDATVKADLAVARATSTQVGIAIPSYDYTRLGGSCPEYAPVNRPFEGTTSITATVNCVRNPVRGFRTGDPVADFSVSTIANAALSKASDVVAQNPLVQVDVYANYIIRPVPGPFCGFHLESVKTDGPNPPDVTVRKKNAVDAIPATPPQTLCEGDYVFVGFDSSAVITIVQGSRNLGTLVMSEVSQLQLNFFLTLDLPAVQIRLDKGVIDATVPTSTPLFPPRWEVVTPSGTAGVRGTIFTVRHDPASAATTVSVQEGQVEVSGASAPFPPTTPSGLPLTLGPGQRVRVTAAAAEPVGVNPAIGVGGVVDAASYRPVLARGGIASVFGSNFVSAVIPAATVPLPLELGGTSVRVDGIRVPLFFVSPTQVNFQLPTTAPLNGQVSIVVANDGAPSPAQTVAVQSYAPGIFTYVRTAGVIDPIVIHLDGTLITPQSAAAPGESVVMFATGIGDLTNLPQTNQRAPISPLAESRTEPIVTIGGASAQVLFTGLTPGFIGLVQINLTIPADVQPGNAPLGVSFGSSVSQPGLTLAIR
jgi:uncharacterized protein (TIGR03437 family)